MTRVLSAVAWPYASGPRHIGHVAGFGVPSDIFSRYMRMAGNDVLMVSGTDEHGTPILVAAEAENMTPREVADRYNRLIVEDLVSLGLSYDLFTRTITPNHYHVAQQMFEAVYANGYFVEKTTMGAISPSTGRTLPDRYVEGICPICGYDGARGDQCDNCGNQLDPIDLKSPRSRINGETPDFVETTHIFLDLPALADAVGEWLGERKDWRPNVLLFSKNLLADIRPRAITRDIDWGIPVPLDGWRENPLKRLYVWFDAVIGYLSASVEWARRTGDPEAWRQWWNNADAQSYYFMGKDNIVFHSLIWPSELLAHNGEGSRGGTTGPFGKLQLPTEVVSSEYLTMEGKKFSASRRVGIYVRDMLSRYSPDSLRYFIAVAGPETQDTDFTFTEFVRRNNDELADTWGNLVNRTVSIAAKNIGSIPEAGELTDEDHSLLTTTREAFGTVGKLIEGHRQKAAISEAMRVAGEANAYLSQQEPWKVRKLDPARFATILHVALQAVDDCNKLLAPFLPFSAEIVHTLLGREGRITGQVELREVDDLDGGPGYPIISGDYSDTLPWRSDPIVPGTPLSAPTPLFPKLDDSVVDEELARLESQA